MKDVKIYIVCKKYIIIEKIMFPYHSPNQEFFINNNNKIELSHNINKFSGNIIFSNLPIFKNEYFYQNINIDVDKLVNNPKLLSKYKIVTLYIDTEM